MLSLHFLSLDLFSGLNVNACIGLDTAEKCFSDTSTQEKTTIKLHD